MAKKKNICIALKQTKILYFYVISATDFQHLVYISIVNIINIVLTDLIINRYYCWYSLF